MYQSDELLVICKAYARCRLARKGVTREQLIDFAYGNSSIENPKITREIAEKLSNQLHKNAKGVMDMVTHLVVYASFAREWT